MDSFAVRETGHLTRIEMGYSPHRLPRVGRIPKREGMYIMAGFTGHGMPQVFLCAEGMTDMALDGVRFGNSGLPSLFEETQARLSDPSNMVKQICYAAFP
jgi:hypothetical protein